jgi:exodeoxyribonuclease-1
LFQKIRAADPESLRDQVWVFKDPRLPELLFRYRARNYRDTLTEDETLRWVEHCQSKLSDPNGFGFAQFQAELSCEMALPNLTEKQRSALVDLTRYAQELAAALNCGGAEHQ